MSISERLLTAEEFASLSNGDLPRELVRGRLVELNQPMPRHGIICGRISGSLYKYLEQHNIGRMFTNDSGIRTSRSPDSVRGADVCFYNYARYPTSSSLDEYPEAPPNVVFEVRSPSDRNSYVLEKVAEYLEVGVDVVVVVDPQSQKATIYRQDEDERILGLQDCLTVPDQLPGFEIAIDSLFG